VEGLRQVENRSRSMLSCLPEDVSHLGMGKSLQTRRRVLVSVPLASSRQTQADQTGRRGRHRGRLGEAFRPDCRGDLLPPSARDVRSRRDQQAGYSTSQEALEVRAKREANPQAQRLAELAWQVHEGRYDDLAKIIRAQGGEFEVHEDGTAVARGVLCTAGFSPGTDPITAFVQVCFALFGVYWTKVPHTGEAQGLVNAQWKERSRA
jgi:hypothetical protein